MKTIQRRILAIIMIIIGLVAFIFGAWLLWGLLFGGGESRLPELPEAGKDMAVTERDVPEPKTYEAPVMIEGESEFDELATASDLTEARNLAVDTIARIGSGTSQDGFLGYEDAMNSATPKLQAFLRSEQLKMKKEFPTEGELYGITTRVIASDVLEGGNGDDRLVIAIQTQKAIDKGNRAEPVEIVYEKHEVTLLRQADGEYLVDYISTEILN